MPRKSKPERRLHLVRRPDAHFPGMFSISTRKTTTFYVFWEIPCDIGGRGFAVHRLGLGELYHVRFGKPSECSCECLGFLRHGACKHLAALVALTEHGELPLAG
jgi:hypothetical protein